MIVVCRQEVPMPRPVTLTAADRTELEDVRDHAPKAYLRERAAAILKVADGTPAAAVARSGLRRRRDSDTLYAWLKRFDEEGIAGLTIRPGRGRKPAFSPSPPRRRLRPARPGGTARSVAALPGIGTQPMDAGVARGGV
jgi:hypothetical protein